MNIAVHRFWTTDKSTISVISAGGENIAVGLEPPIKHDDSKPRAIPAGTYDLDIRTSQRFGRLMPHVENVPGFEGILLHWGNMPKDTEGCLLIGEERGPSGDFVTNSREAFGRLFDMLIANPGEKHTICYIDPPASSDVQLQEVKP